MEDLFTKIQQYSYDNPRYIYLIIGIISFLFFVGIWKNKNWAIDPSNSSQKLFYNWAGRKAFRIVALGVALLGMIGGILSFITS